MATVARRHAEWISLLEISGPFLSMPVLLKAFPQGLDAHDPEHARQLRADYDEWIENNESYRPDPAIHRAWIDFVLKDALGFTDNVLLSGQQIPEGLSVLVAVEGETLRPDFVLVNPPGSDNAGKARLLMQVLPATQGVEKAMEAHRWKASPASRMLELLKATETRLGLVTNGEQWMLVNAPKGESTGYITWTADLWAEEPITLQAFRSLLGLRRFFGVDDSQTIESLLNESLEDQQEVTDQLGYQVRKAVEVFIQAFDRIDQDSNRELLRNASPNFLYEAALTVMMRLVFLLSAEERGLFMLGEEMYDQHYAVSTLRAQLRETADQHGEEVLSRRSDAWCRLLATFRAVYGGVEHDALRLPAYGGNLFDPDRFPFLEGRAPNTNWRETAADPLPINNQIVLHLLEALQILRVKVPGGPPEPRRLSFSALGVEQIGHVYEGLLDHTAVRATSPVLGLVGAKNQESEIQLTELERLRERGEEELVEYLKKETGRQSTAIKRALDSAAVDKKVSDQIDAQHLLQACNNDARLCERVRPFAKLLRLDTMDFPVVINAGSLYVTTGSERRSSGTYYTPPSLTEPIVKYALDPLVYIGPAEGLPETEWRLKSAKEILDLKVCDMAMGSGAFLVQVCRYLAEKLVEAWGDVEAKNPGAFIVTPDGELSKASETERLLPLDVDERILIARRYIADKCLYGVDRNELAVNMAKLSLWLVTLQRDRPFTFLNHALKCGDSLLGVTSLDQIETFSLRGGERQVTFATANLFRYVEEAGRKRRELEELPSNTHTQIELKARLNAEAEAATVKVKAISDCLVALELRPLDGNAYEDERAQEAEQVQLLIQRDAETGIETSNTKSQLARAAHENLGTRRPFHWPTEFPEVFSRGGFDAFIGNPPFMGGGKISAALGADYALHLHKHCWQHAHGNADLVAYFFLRAAVLLRSGGMFALLSTNTIAQGDTADTGLRWLINYRHLQIVNARSSFPWPGTAAVFVSVVVGRFGQWNGSRFLDGVEVASIGASLDSSGTSTKPFKLFANAGLSSEGSKLYAKGFVLDEKRALKLIEDEPSAVEIVRPFNTGEDFNNSPTQSPSRWCVDFRTFELDIVANRWPKTLAYVEEFVKPERQRVSDQRARELWWQHQRPRTELYSSARRLPRVLAKALVTSVWGFAFADSHQVFANKITVFLLPEFKHFALLQSSIHEAWAWTWGSTMKSDLNYSHSDCFQTFPFPTDLSRLDAPGDTYYEFRRQIMLTQQEGLTRTYRRFHDPAEQLEGIVRLRQLHLGIDQIVAAAYGWSDLDLGHGFHETKQGERFTISEFARREVLNRLLQLNHERYAEEQRLGLHGKNRGKAKKKRKSVAATPEANTAQVKLQLS